MVSNFRRLQTASLLWWNSYTQSTRSFPFEFNMHSKQALSCNSAMSGVRTPPGTLQRIAALAYAPYYQVSQYRSRLFPPSQRLCGSSLPLLSYSSLRFSTSSANITAASRISTTQHPVIRPATTTTAKYKVPTTGILSRLPSSLVPFAELVRLEKPTGTYYLYLPCLFSTLLAGLLSSPVPPPSVILGTNALFLLGSAIFRGAACTWNDTLDRDLDAKVTRTRLRPLPRGAVTAGQAHTWTAVQVAAGAGVLAMAFPFPITALYAVPSVIIIGLYPLAKRVTNYPQVVLGFAWSWGVIMGFPAMGIDLLAPENHTALAAAGTLYAANIAWTVLYDTIYAHQDVKDDTRIGIKSIAVKHGTKTLLAGLGAVQVSLLAVTGWIVGAGPVYFLGTCGGATTALATMIWRARLDRPENCWWWFKWGCWFTGGSVASGLMGEYWVRWKTQEEEKKDNILKVDMKPSTCL